MADEQHELKSINWKETFGFTQIFHSFRLAIHPSKILLALAAIVLVYVWGSWVLDNIWGVTNTYAKSDEIQLHATQTPEQFRGSMDNWNDGRAANALNLYTTHYAEAVKPDNFAAKLPAGDLQDAYRAKVNGIEAREAISADARKKLLEDNESGYGLLSKAADEFDDELDKIRSLIDQAETDAEKKIKESQNLNDEQKEEALEKLEEDVAKASLAVAEYKKTFWETYNTHRGQPIFDLFLAYEGDCLDNALRSVYYGNITGGLDNYLQTLRNRVGQPVRTEIDTGIRDTQAIPANGRTAGFLCWVAMMAEGLCWMIWQHPVFAVCFLLPALALWAFFGGAIYRIAALHSAREEKISIGQAMRFSCGKFLSFFTAPLIPLGIIVVIGLLVSLGSLLGNIPYVGEIIVAVLFFLPIVAGLLIAFLLIGLVGGFPLMYPTVAVEGSDSFDAISRSFSYLFARPWKAGLYALVAVVYGTITYLFVRLFLFLAMLGTHFFVSVGFIGSGSTELGSESDKLDLIWSTPTFTDLTGGHSWLAMDGAEKFAAGVISVWTFLVASLAAAYLLSFFASASTMIYYLLRKGVDATDLDDVYVEESEGEELPPAATEQTGEQADTTTEEASETPSEESSQPEAEPEEAPEEGESSDEASSQEGSEPEQEESQPSEDQEDKPQE